jgi:5S rRNA maturation endonuclease (ribonuclease M5)
MVKFNPQLKHEIEKYQQYVVVVEGKKDVASLKHLGFEKVYAIHATGTPIRIRVEQIVSLLEKKDKICILTDLDKKGKQLYMLLKTLFQEKGVNLDSRLRGILIKTQVNQVEGLSKFMDKINKI